MVKSVRMRIKDEDEKRLPQLSLGAHTHTHTHTQAYLVPDWTGLDTDRQDPKDPVGGNMGR